MELKSLMELKRLKVKIKIKNVDFYFYNDYNNTLLIEINKVMYEYFCTRL
jgi:hypothetical protein